MSSVSLPGQSCFSGVGGGLAEGRLLLEQGGVSVLNLSLVTNLGIIGDGILRILKLRTPDSLISASFSCFYGNIEGILSQNSLVHF